MTCWLCGIKTTELATNPKAPTCKNGHCQICIAVDEEINQKAATLRRLLLKRCDLRSEQNRDHGTLLHRLPTEIKSYIIELLLPLRDKWGGFIEFPRPKVMPLYLASTCRSWRDIAWSNPVLWSTIHTTIELPYDPSRRINYMQDWIQRSRILPLTLDIQVLRKEGFGEESFGEESFGEEDFEEERFEEELKSVIDVIGKCSDRLDSLSLDISFKWFHAIHLTDLQCPLLRRLKIGISGSNSMPDNYVRHAPLLNLTASPEEIELWGISFRSLKSRGTTFPLQKS